MLDLTFWVVVACYLLMMYRQFKADRAALLRQNQANLEMETIDET